MLCYAQLLQFFETPGAVAHQDPLSKGFSRQEYWSGLPFPPPADLLDPGIKPISKASPALADRFFTTEPHGKPNRSCYSGKNISFFRPL